MFNKALFSSARGDWKTPAALLEKLDKEFNFNFDAAPVNPEFDSLDENFGWNSRTYVNPPYGPGLYKWLAKAWQEYMKKNLVVMLLPARTDTRWFHDFCLKATEIRFIKGRLKFDDQKNSAPFPSMIVVFKP